MTGYLARLDARITAVGSALCLGIDPDPAAFPQGYAADVSGIERFANLIVDAASEHAAAIKVNIAFFEAFGSAGIAALERLRARVPAEIPFIADAKRTDISTTAARQAVALFDSLGADAITANPYLGRDALEPFFSHGDRFVYVLCRTSNPGAAEFQSLPVDGAPLYQAVARRVAEWSNEGAPVGLVVGATAPVELAEIREVAPGLPLLVPGIGTQGGDVDAVLRDGPASAAPGAAVRGGALLVNVSRGISSAALETDDPRAAIARAAEEWATRLPVLG
ncbi:MAG: orotidine-5'-phosphate decarboxylase [Chloroflexota bacterium]